MTTPLRLLVLEDQPDDAELMVETLRLTGYDPTWERVDSEGEYLAHLSANLELILADFNLPQFDGERALELLKSSGLDIPFILVSGSIGEDIAVSAMQAGATDYLRKDRLAYLGQAVARAIAQKRLRQEHQQADQELRRQQHRFQALIEHAADGIALVDRNGRLEYVSPSSERIMGFSSDQVIGRDPGEFTHPDDLPMLLEKLGELLQNPGKSTTVEYRFRHQDGSWRWLESTITNLLTEPDVGAVVFNYHDVSERKQAAAALAASETKFRALIENSADAIVLLDHAGTVLYASQTTGRMLGAEADYWVGGNWLNRAHPDDLDTISTLFGEILREPGASRTTQFRYRHMDGSWRWLEATGTNLLNEPAVRAIVGNLRDISERKRAEQSLHESEERFRHLFDASPDAILLLDPHDGEDRWPILDCNEAACRMNGYTRQELVGQSIDILNLEKGTPEGRHEYYADVRRNGILHVEALHRHKDGHTFPIESLTSIIRVGGQELILGMDRDITERKRTEAEIARRADQFSALYETARDLSGQNDLQTLLRAIVERATLLLHAPGGALLFYDAARRDLEIVVTQGSTLKIGRHINLGTGIAGRVAETHQPLVVNDLDWSDPPPGSPDLGMQASVQVPMLYQGELIGVLTVNALDPAQRFTTADMNLLSLFATQAAGAVHNARLLAETTRRAAYLSTLNAIGRAVSTLQNIDDALQEIYRQVQHSVLLDMFFIGLYDSDTKLFRYRLLYDEGIRYEQDPDVLLEGTSLFKIIHTGEPILINRSAEEVAARDSRGRLANTSKPSASLLFVPLQIGQRVVGVMSAQSYTLNVYTQEHLNLLMGIASQAAIAIENARLFEETQRRVAELEAINRLSATLRVAQSLEEMLPGLLNEALAVLNAHIGSIWLYDPLLDAVHLQVWRDWSPDSPRLLKRGQGIPGHVLETGEMYVAGELKSDPNASEQVRASIPRGVNGVCIPIRTGNDFRGVLFVVVEAPRRITPGELELVETFAEMGGGAIHRMQLHEQTKYQVQYLGALRTIDMAISGNADLGVTLNILLEQVLTQLHIDASCVLLLNRPMHTLDYSAGRGFRTNSITRTHIRLGEGLAGRIALDGRMVVAADLANSPIDFARAHLLADEGFVEYYGVPLKTKGHITGVLEIFHRAPIHSSPEWLEFLQALAGQAAIAVDNATLFQGMQRSNMELSLAYDATIEGWSRALDLRDRETEGHSKRVTEMTLRLALAMHMGEGELVHIRRGALLHDIGKMGIPDSILLKPGPLTEQEWEVMRMHPLYAYELLASIEYLRPALDIPYAHHERWDGSGYPRGLKGDQIPRAARLFAVVDVWDALCSDRPYRKAWTDEQARTYIREQSGIHFDPEVVDAFLAVERSRNPKT